MRAARSVAIAEAIVVVLILGSTLVLAKAALAYLGPLTTAALRYCLAFLFLLPFLNHRGAVNRWPAQLWLRFLIIGFSFYVVGNGALFLGLHYLTATTAALLLNFIPLLVLLAGALWLREIPTRWQATGVLVALVGAMMFFSPGLRAGEPLGIAIVAIGLVGNAAFGLIGREVTREQHADTLALTAIPLAFGGAILLPIALATEGLPQLSLAGWGILLCLAVINTACAYLLYNHVLRVLAAFEMSAMSSLSPLVTALLAWLFLHERLGMSQIGGIVIVILGVVLVQIGKPQREAASTS